MFEDKGHIVNAGPCSAEASSVTRGEYCISKTAVCMLITLSADCLTSEGIIVNEVRSDVVAIDTTSAVIDKYNRIIANEGMSITHWRKPEGVTQMASLFCLNKAPYTTSSYIDVDGGFHIKRL